MVKFKKETNKRYTTWTAPVVNNRIIYIKERHSCKGEFDLFVLHQRQGKIYPDCTEYLGTFDDISKAKMSARQTSGFVKRLMK